METAFVIVPGLGNSGELHWQSLWEKKYRNFYRVEQKQWINPYCPDWIHTIEKTIEQLSGKQIIIVAHSLGCIAVAHWAQQSKQNVNGALLVAPPDIQIIQKYNLAQGFTSVPRRSLPFESMLVASSNDDFASERISKHYATLWNSQYICIGAKGHINADSGFGHWPEGYELLNTFVNSLQLI